MDTEQSATGPESQEPAAQLDTELTGTFRLLKDASFGTNIETPVERRARLEQAAREQIGHLGEPAPAAAPPPADQPLPPADAEVHVETPEEKIVRELQETLASLAPAATTAPPPTTPPPPPAAESRPGTTDVLGEDIRRALADIDSEPGDQPVTLDDDKSRQIREELQAELAALQTEDDSPEYRLEIKKRFYDSKAAEMDPEAGSTFEFLQTLQAEYRRLGEERGAYSDVDWLLGVDPQLVRRLPKKIIEALEAFGDEENPKTRDELEYQIAMAADITNRQLQDFATSDTAYSAAESDYEEILKEVNSLANPGFRLAFVNRNAAAIEFYTRANKLREMRVAGLKEWGLIQTSPAATLATLTTLAPRPLAVPPPAATLWPEPAPPRQAADLPREAAAIIVDERTPGKKLINSFDEILKRSQVPSVPIDVPPTTLAGYLKETFRFAVDKVLIKTIYASLESINLEEDGAVDLLASGAIVAPGAKVDFSNIEIGNYAPNGGVSIYFRDTDIVCSGNAEGHEAEVRNALANLIKTLTDGINGRLEDKNWQVEGLHIQDGKVRFNFKKKIKSRA